MTIPECSVLACPTDQAPVVFSCARCNAFNACRDCLQRSIVGQETARLACPHCKAPWPLVELLRVFGKATLLGKDGEWRRYFHRIWRKDIERIEHDASALQALQRKWSNLAEGLEALEYKRHGRSFPEVQQKAIDFCRSQAKRSIQTFENNEHPVSLNPLTFCKAFHDHRFRSRLFDSTHRKNGSKGTSVMYARCPQDRCSGWLESVQREGIQGGATEKETAALHRPCPYVLKEVGDTKVPDTIQAARPAQPWLLCDCCDTPVCPHCYVVVGKDAGALDSHACDPRILMNLASIKGQRARPCPQCRAQIVRQYGCDHMFCSHCHFKFNWSSGHGIADNAFHNPHIVELQRKSAEERAAAEARAEAVRKELRLPGGPQAAQAREAAQAVEEPDHCNDMPLDDELLTPYLLPKYDTIAPIGSIRAAPRGVHECSELKRNPYNGVYNDLLRFFDDRVRSVYRGVDMKLYLKLRHLIASVTRVENMAMYYEERAADPGRAKLLCQSLKEKNGEMKVQRNTVARTLFYQKAKQQGFAALAEAFRAVQLTLAQASKEIRLLLLRFRRENVAPWSAFKPEGWFPAGEAVQETYSAMQKVNLNGYVTRQQREELARVVDHVWMQLPTLVDIVTHAWTQSKLVWDQYPSIPVPMYVPVAHIPEYLWPDTKVDVDYVYTAKDARYIPQNGKFRGFRTSSEKNGCWLLVQRRVGSIVLFNTGELYYTTEAVTDNFLVTRPNAGSGSSSDIVGGDRKRQRV